jgi:hypothetical protein
MYLAKFGDTSGYPLIASTNYNARTLSGPGFQDLDIWLSGPGFQDLNARFQDLGFRPSTRGFRPDSQDLGFRTSIFGSQDLGIRTSTRGFRTWISGPGFQDLESSPSYGRLIFFPSLFSASSGPLLPPLLPREKNPNPRIQNRFCRVFEN